MAELKFPTLEELGRQGGEWALDVFEYKGQTIREWVDKITTGEYQPVKHGHWIHCPEEDENAWRCSECTGGWLLPDGDTPEANRMEFCHRCGAKMDGGDT